MHTQHIHIKHSHMDETSCCSSTKNKLDEARLWRDRERWARKAAHMVEDRCQRRLEKAEDKLLLQSHLSFCASSLPPARFQRPVAPFQDAAIVGFLHLVRSKGIIKFLGLLNGMDLDWKVFRVASKERKTFEKALLILFGMMMHQNDDDNNRASMGVNSEAWQVLQESFWHLGYRPRERTRVATDDAMYIHTVWSMAFSGEMDFVFRL